MQCLNNGLNMFKMDDSTHVIFFDISRNVKKIIKPFEYNCKILSYICFNIL